MEAAPDHSRLPLVIRALSVVWAALALAIMVSFWQGPYLFNLASPFRVHWLLGLLLAGLPLAVLYPHPRRWIFLALPLVVAGTFLSYIAPKSSRLDPSVPVSKTRIAVTNILSSNHDLTRLSAWLAEEKPEIVGLTEVSEAHRVQLESLPFAHKALYPRNSNFGVGLLCQQAPSDIVVVDENSPFPSLLATWPEYRLLVTHPIPPISRGARVAGDEQMQRLVTTLNDGTSPLLVMGDLNATGWDRRLQPLREAGMVEARLGHGLLPTWPANSPIFGIPIDHIYLPPGWESLDCRRGPDIGSDHYPLVCDVAWVSPAVKLSPDKGTP